jgi:hypothetical protein
MRSRSRWLPSLCLYGAIALFCSARGALAAQAEISGIEKVYLRSGAGPDQPPIGVLNQGDRVNIIDIEGSWTKVETADGKVGFVYHRYVVPVFDGSAPAAPPPTTRPAPRVPAAPIAPSVAQPPPAPVAAEPPAPPTPIDQLSTELAGLRAEVAELKQKVQQRAVENTDEQSRGAVSAPAYAPTSVDLPPGASQPASPREQGVGVLAVAVLSLIVGWVLGSAFSRRRSRVQRPRLRF